MRQQKNNKVIFLTDQIDDDIDNKAQIKRCKEFREMVYSDIITLLHDKKDIILKTHKNNIIDA